MISELSKNLEHICVLTEEDHKVHSNLQQALQSENRDDWIKADVVELKRLLDIDGVDMIRHQDLPNVAQRPRQVVRVFEHKSGEGKGRRIKAAFNGSKRKATVELTISYTDEVLKSMREFTEKDREDLIDALAEWNEVVEPKELHPDEVGLDSARYHNILNKLRAWE